MIRQLGDRIAIADWISIIRMHIRKWWEMKWMYEHSQLGIKETFWDLDSLKFHEDWAKYKAGLAPHPFDDIK